MKRKHLCDNLNYEDNVGTNCLPITDMLSCSTRGWNPSWQKTQVLREREHFVSDISRSSSSSALFFSEHPHPSPHPLVLQQILHDGQDAELLHRHALRLPHDPVPSPHGRIVRCRSLYEQLLLPPERLYLLLSCMPKMTRMLQASQSSHNLFLNFFTNLMLLNTFIPLSLMVTLEVSIFLQVLLRGRG